MTEKTVYRLLCYEVEGGPSQPFAVIVERGSAAAARVVGDLDDLSEAERLTWIGAFLEARGVPSDRAPLMENWRIWLDDYCESTPERRTRMQRRLLTHTPGVSLDEPKVVRMKGSVAQIAARLLRSHLHDPFELRCSDLVHTAVFGNPVEFVIRRRCEVEFSNGHRVFADYALDRKHSSGEAHSPADSASSIPRLGVPEPDDLPLLPAWLLRKRRVAQLLLVRCAKTLDVVQAVEQELRPITEVEAPRIQAIVLSLSSEPDEYRRLRREGIHLIPAMDQHAGSRLLRVLLGM